MDMKEKLKITNGCTEGYYDGEVDHQHFHNSHHCLYYFNILIPIENVIWDKKGVREFEQF